MKKIIITCFLAGCLEMYDFAIFGFLSEILKQHYINFLSEESASIVIYLLFAIGFVFRPIGSCIFGYIGDNFGRKKALTISIFLMSVSCLGMAILPSYTSIGVISCYIIILLRVLQGISIGGEYSGCLVFAVEHSKKEYRGLIGSIITAGFMSGILLAALINNLLSIKSLPEYSWRFAFILGFMLSLIGYFIRNYLQETPQYKKIKSNIYKNNFWKTIKFLKFKLLYTILIVATSGTNFYFNSIYLPNYLEKITQVNYSWLSLQNTFLMAIFVPFFGYISDKVDRIKLMSISALALAFYTINLCFILRLNTDYIVYLSMLHIVITAAFTGPMNSLIIEIFPIEVRYTCSSFCFSIGIALGGLTPMVSVLLNQCQNYNWYLSFYIATFSLLSFHGLKFVTMLDKHCKYITLDNVIKRVNH